MSASLLTRYTRGERNPETREAARLHGLAYARRRAYGRSDYVDAAPVRAHVHTLLESGIGWELLARLSEVPRTSLASLIYGRQAAGPRYGQTLTRVKRVNADRLLAFKIEPSMLPDGALTDARPTARRVRALVGVGWSVKRQAADMGYSLAGYQRILTRPKVTMGMARAVAAYYDTHSLAAPTDNAAAVSRSIARARAAGWPLPMDWEAGNIDGPNEVKRSVA